MNSNQNELIPIEFISCLGQVILKGKNCILCSQYITNSSISERRRMISAKTVFRVVWIIVNDGGYRSTKRTQHFSLRKE